MRARRQLFAFLSVASLLVASVIPARAELGPANDGSAPSHWETMMRRLPERPAIDPMASPRNGLAWKTRRADHADVALEAVDLADVQSLRLLNHANKPVKVVMGVTAQTADEVEAMLAAIVAIDQADKLSDRERIKLHLVCQDEAAFRRVKIAPEAARYVELNEHFGIQEQDVWLQDWGELAVVKTAGDTKEKLVVFDTNRGRASLARLPEVLARSWSGRYLKKATSNQASAGDYGGNIEVTPDDVLYLGNTSSPELRDMFARSGYRDRTAVLRADWLKVGHVDEYLTTLPCADRPRGYVIVKADPERALALLAKIPASQREAQMEGLLRAAYPNGFPMQERFDIPEEIEGVRKVFGGLFGVSNLLGGAIPGSSVPVLGANVAGFDLPELVAANHDVAKLIDAQVETLITTVTEATGDPTRPDIVSIPILFEPLINGKTIALTPGAVNLVSLRHHAVIPDPLLPAFRDDTRAQLAAVGIRSHFVQNLSYHSWEGELHCGSNVLRLPNEYLVPPSRAARRMQVGSELTH